MTFHGNRINMLLFCVTFACFQVLTSAGIERSYAIELIGDLAWKVYEKWGQVPILIARLLTGDSCKRMCITVNMFLRFPFSPSGYIFKRLPCNDGILLDMLRCSIAEYSQAHEASDLCIGTRCNLDFPLAEMWGGWLELTETLAAGNAHCDFRFKTAAQNETT